MVFRFNLDRILTLISVIILLGLFLFSIISNYNNNDFIKLCRLNDLEGLSNYSNSCIYNVIEENKNFSLCEYTLNKNNCYEEFALKYNLLNLCDLTSNNSKCIFDLAIFAGNESICYNLDSISLKDICFFQISLKKSDPKICEHSSNIGKCYYSYAFSKKEIKICDFAGDYKKVCYDKLID